MAKVKKQGMDDHLKQWDGTEGWSMTGLPKSFLF